MKVAVYFTAPEASGYPFDDPDYIRAYAGFHQSCRARGLDLYIVRGGSYQGAMTFAHGWTFVDGALQAVPGPISVDVVYNKGNFQVCMRGNERVLNNPAVKKVCDDKWLTYQLFPDIMAKTVLLNAAHWREQIATLPTDLIVIKPTDALGGDGIVVADKATFDWAQLDPRYPQFVAQAFIESSAGIPGIVTGRHDLRLYVYGTVRFAEIRQPKAGGYLANIAKGGSLFMFPLEKLPKAAWDFYHQIDPTFAAYTPRIYTIDMMFENGRPYLVELNAQPGTPFPEWDQWDHFYTKSHRYIIDLLIAANHG